MGSFPSFFSYFSHISEAVCIKQSNSRSTLIRLSLGSSCMCLSLCHEAKIQSAQLSPNSLPQQRKPQFEGHIWVIAGPFSIGLMPLTSVHQEGSLPRPVPNHEESALTSPTVKNADQEPGASHQKERSAASKGWLSQVLTCLPGCGPMGALRNLVWKWFLYLAMFTALRKPGRIWEKTSLMAMGVLLPAGNETQGNSAAQR